MPIESLLASSRKRPMIPNMAAVGQYSGPWPSITCICPTYGRFHRLQDALACFILQDYQGDRTLLISNDSPVPLQLTDASIFHISPQACIVIRNESPWPTVGIKKQALLDSVRAEFIGHWEDDDLYMPWHLSSSIAALMVYPEYECVKANTAWRLRNPLYVPSKKWIPCDRRIGHYDGQMVFRRGTSTPYKKETRGIELPLILDYRDRGKMIVWEPWAEDMSYVYRIYDGIKHLCRCGKYEETAERMWKKKNRDFGEGPLLPDYDLIEWAQNQIRPLLLRVVRRIEEVCEQTAIDKIYERLPWVIE